MSFKKLLFVMLVIIVFMFGLMLATSYAWYSYENASTKFDTVTADNDVSVTYFSSKYINTAIAIPINVSEIDEYSEKCIFSIDVTSKRRDNEIMSSVYLKDVEISDELKDKNLKIELYYQNEKIGEGINGENISSGADILIDSVILEGYTENLFEVRVYILDDGTDQSAMMGKSFKGTVEVESVYRLGKLENSDTGNSVDDKSSISDDITNSSNDENNVVSDETNDINYNYE